MYVKSEGLCVSDSSGKPAGSPSGERGFEADSTTAYWFFLNQYGDTPKYIHMLSSFYFGFAGVITVEPVHQCKMYSTVSSCGGLIISGTLNVHGFGDVCETVCGSYPSCYEKTGTNREVKAKTKHERPGAW